MFYKRFLFFNYIQNDFFTMSNRLGKIILFLGMLIANHSFGQTVVNMEKEGGIFKVPCTVNGIPMKFIFDTGASQVSISLSEAIFMYKNGSLTDNEILGNMSFQDATGKISNGTRIIIKKIEIGGLKIENIQASIVHNLNAPLLLGQTALAKLGQFNFDPQNGTLTLLGDYRGSGSPENSKYIEYYNKSFEELRNAQSVEDVNKSLNYLSMAIKLNPLFYEAYWARAYYTFKYFDTNGQFIPIKIDRDFPDEIKSQIESDFRKAININDLEIRSSWLIDLSCFKVCKIGMEILLFRNFSVKVAYA